MKNKPEAVETEAEELLYLSFLKFRTTINTECK